MNILQLNASVRGAASVSTRLAMGVGWKKTFTSSSIPATPSRTVVFRVLKSAWPFNDQPFDT